MLALFASSLLTPPDAPARIKANPISGGQDQRFRDALTRSFRISQAALELMDQRIVGIGVVTGQNRLQAKPLRCQDAFPRRKIRGEFAAGPWIRNAAWISNTERSDGRLVELALQAHVGEQGGVTGMIPAHARSELNDEGQGNAGNERSVRHCRARAVPAFQRLDLKSCNLEAHAPGCRPNLGCRNVHCPEIGLDLIAAQDRCARKFRNRRRVPEVIAGRMRDKDEVDTLKIFGLDQRGWIAGKERVKQNPPAVGYDDFIGGNTMISNVAN
ncbi:hypothetical protein ACVWZ3_000082 [Bradyrhizobium sp. i1.3.6]